MLYSKDIQDLEAEGTGAADTSNWPKGEIVEVVWRDGTRDKRDCDMCISEICAIPTHIERYRIKSNVIASNWDRNNPVV